MADKQENDQSLDTIKSIFEEVDTLDDSKEDQEAYEERLLAQEDIDNESDPEPQEESDSDTNEDDVVDGAEEGADKEEPAKDEEDDVSKKLSDLEGRLKETQKWGKTQNQEAKELKKKLEALVADGTVNKEELDSLEIEADDPTTEVREQFEAEFPIIQRYMKANGDDKAEEYAVAYDTMSQYDRTLTQDILELPREERIPAIIAKGKTMVEDYKVMKEHKGNLREVFKAIEKRAVDAYKSTLEELKDDDEEDTEGKTKVEPKVATKASKSTRPKLKQAGTAKDVAPEDNSVKGILFGK